MQSELYRRACARLAEPDRDGLRHCETWLQDHSDRSEDPLVRGAQILANLRQESHLLGKASFGDPEELVSFLREWSQAHAKVSEPMPRRRCYQDACRSGQGKGSPVPTEALPTKLLRFSSSRSLLAQMIARILGEAARRDFDNRTLAPEDAVARLRRRWTPDSFGPTDRLGRGDVVFATFESAAGPPRNSPIELAEALGLGVARSRAIDRAFLVELEYEAVAVAEPRIPTVADAGWFDLFRPAAEAPPDAGDLKTCYGWTGPLGAQAPQPEIVHANASLRVVVDGPRWIGRLVP